MKKTSGEILRPLFEGRRVGISHRVLRKNIPSGPKASKRREALGQGEPQFEDKLEGRAERKSVYLGRGGV